MLDQGVVSVVAMVGAIVTLFVGLAAVTNARRINQQKHEHHHHEAHSG
jgi:NADH:ubiquinone oxidoreductase subunit 6 (subunit J)